MRKLLPVLLTVASTLSLISNIPAFAAIFDFTIGVCSDCDDALPTTRNGTVIDAFALPLHIQTPSRTRAETRKAPTASPTAILTNTPSAKPAVAPTSTFSPDAPIASPAVNRNATSDASTSNTDGKTLETASPKFLFGIFSMAAEAERRQFMRDTMLRFFKDTENRNSTRICSFNDILAQKINITDCQIAYVFVVGGRESGPTQLLTPSDENPMSIPLSQKLTEEPDVVALNIQENMNEGKTPTFYKYASTITDYLQNATGSSFDYIVKMDTDTMLFPPKFLEFASEHFPLGRSDHVYAGKPIAHMKVSPHKWVSGALQILSPSLAAAITAPDVAGALEHENHEFAKRLLHEDFEISYRVHAYGTNVTKIWMHKKHVLDQPSKSPSSTFMRRKPYDFRSIVFGHTEWGNKKFSRSTPGPFFKHLPTARKIWRHYLHWFTNNEKPVDNIYHLYDMRQQNASQDLLLVQPNDYIYSDQDFDSSPIVLEDYRLVFFPIEGNGASRWRQLFRRMLGTKDWQHETRQFEGLTYLSDFDQVKATEIMTSPKFTRAVIVQDPKTRFVASYVNNVVNDPKEQELMRTTCCGDMWELKAPGSERHPGVCAKQSKPVSLDLFVELVKECDQPYWRPQSRRMEPKYFNYINFLGHHETIQDDSMKLLQKIGAWEEFGMNGWGDDGTKSFFDVSSARKVPPTTFPASIEELAETGIYSSDYEEAFLGLTKL